MAQRRALLRPGTRLEVFGLWPPTAPHATLPDPTGGGQTVAARLRMPHADAAWLHMDGQVNLMIVTGMLWFDAPVDWERLREVFEARVIDHYPRFRQRVVDRHAGVGGAYLVEDDRFDLDLHLTHLRLPEPGDRRVLQDLVGWIMSTDLDRRRPLWQAYLVDGYGDGSAVVFRAHHCVADGIALGQVLLELTDADPEASPEGTGRMEAAPGRPGGATAVLGRAVALLRHPVGSMGRGATNSIRQTASLVRLVGLPPDHRSLLKGPMGSRKLAAWSDPIPLERVKAIGRKSGATMNDVLLAATAGTLHEYLARRQPRVTNLRAFVPYNLRPLDAAVPNDLGNRFGLVFLTLPVGLPTPAERLVDVKRRMDRIKRTPEGTVSYEVLDAIGRVPLATERLLVAAFGSKGSVVVTNVPGPRDVRYVAGTPLAGVLAWVPQSGHVGLGVALFSYAGDVFVGVGADAMLVPEPAELVDGFNSELARLEAEK